MKSSCKVRPAGLADVKNLADIDMQASPGPWSEAQLARACGGEGNECAILVEHEAGTAGFVIFSCVLDEASIHNIVVGPNAQRRGFGRLLLDNALEEMRRRCVNRCLLEVRRSNIPAQALYQGRGFGLDGVRKNYYPTTEGREDALLMSLQL